MPTSLWAFISTSDVVLEGIGLFFREWATEECEGAEGLLQMQNQLGSHALVEDVGKPSQDELDESQDNREATHLHAWVLLALALISVTSWRTSSGMRR